MKILKKLLAVASILILLSGSLLIFGYLYEQKVKENEQLDKIREIENSRLRISPSEIDISNLEITLDSVTGRIKNNSEKYSITKIILEIDVKDCAGNNRECVIVEQSSVSYKWKIPPSQARDFNKALILLSPVDIQGTVAFDYRIEEIYAK